MIEPHPPWRQESDWNLFRRVYLRARVGYLLLTIWILERRKQRLQRELMTCIAGVVETRKDAESVLRNALTMMKH